MKADRHDWLYLLWGANAWEQDEGLIDAVGRTNLQKLASASHLEASVASAARGRLEHRLAQHAAAPITAPTILERVDEVTQRFQLVGYDEFCAGHEGSIRQRLWEACGTPWGVDLVTQDLTSPDTQRWAAYYMAFTDFCLSEADW